MTEQTPETVEPAEDDIADDFDMDSMEGEVTDDDDGDHAALGDAEDLPDE